MSLYIGYRNLPAAAATAPAPAPQENKGNFCMICGTPRNGNKYCSKCGAEFN